MLALKGKFEGWLVDQENGIIFDEGGNRYDIPDIRQVFVTRNWLMNHTGTDSNIISLKEQLQAKIEQVKLPVVTISWGDETISLTHPMYNSSL